MLVIVLSLCNIYISVAWAAVFVKVLVAVVKFLYFHLKLLICKTFFRCGVLGLVNACGVLNEHIPKVSQVFPSLVMEASY